MSKANESNWYANVFKSWQVKLLGPKPTNEMLASVHGLGARPGKQALANAMGLRDCGVTNGQIIIACGAPQLNKMRGFITDRLLNREPVPPSAEGHTVYKLTVTPKGLQRIKQAEARAAKADAEGKADGEAKPAKVNVKAKAKAERKAKGKAAMKHKAHVEGAQGVWGPDGKMQAIADVGVAEIEGKPLEQVIAEREADTASGVE